MEPCSDEYIAIMDVLETSVTDLSPREVSAALSSKGMELPLDVVEARLDTLRNWHAVSWRTDTSQIRRHADLLSRNWRYTASSVGRRVQRFYRTVLKGTPAVREIPLVSLAQAIDAAEELLKSGLSTAERVQQIGTLFVNQDHLDAALVGAEDSLSSLSDRFNLSDSSTAELKQLLVQYATRVATVLDQGSARAHRALLALQPQFAALADAAVTSSDAHELIRRGALDASRGGRVSDWESLLAWFDPNSGRAYRFSFKLIRALPGMHINLRRHHTSSGTATSRSRALMFARACLHPMLGTSIFLAAVGDHQWRKLHGDVDDEEYPRSPSWRSGPKVEVPELLRAVGRGGARGRLPAARDDAGAREFVEMKRLQRLREHEAALTEILAKRAGDELSEPAARVALAVLLMAAHAPSEEGRRTAVRDGLACTLVDVPGATGALLAPSWQILTPGREIRFHDPAAEGQRSKDERAVG